MRVADDAALLIGGDTRRELEETAAECSRLITDWGICHEMEFNETEAIMLKLPVGIRAGSYRNPTIRLGGRRVRFKTAVRYLGVLIDRNFLFAAHRRAVVDRAKATYYDVARLVRVDWGVPFGVGQLVYQATVEFIVTYAASALERRVWSCRKYAVLWHAVGLRAAQRTAI